MFNAASYPTHGIHHELPKHRLKRYEVGAKAILEFAAARGVDITRKNTHRRIHDLMAAIESVDGVVDGFGPGFSLETFDRVVPAIVSFIRSGDETNLQAAIVSKDTCGKLVTLRRHLLASDADLEAYARVVEEVFAHNRVVHTTKNGREFLDATGLEGEACEGLVSPLVEGLSSEAQKEFRLLLSLLNEVDNVADLRKDRRNGEIALSPMGQAGFLSRAALRIPKKAVQWLSTSWRNKRKAKRSDEI